VDWASYKKTKKGIKLHLSFNLNSLTPSMFLVAEGNSSERNFLKSIIEMGHTYIADRGYFSFDLAHYIDKARAYFIFRLKENFLFEAIVSLDINSDEVTMPRCFNQVKDEIVYFINDPNKIVYRLIRFRVLNSYFTICTNRFDLNTLQIIMLYAYRWQIELFFKFIKRTLNGIHLFSTSENGAQIHFLIILITALLQIKLKQNCIREMKKQKNTEKIDKILKCDDKKKKYTGLNPSIWVQNIAQIFNNEYKISAHWLLYFRNFIAKNIDYHVIMTLATN
jgi:Transposase DDE domain